MDEPNILNDVLRRALLRCDARPPCLECVSGAAVEVLLEQQLGGDALEPFGETWPVEEEIAV